LRLDLQAQRAHARRDSMLIGVINIRAIYGNCAKTLKVRFYLN
jgi:hypothetical protein